MSMNRHTFGPTCDLQDTLDPYSRAQTPLEQDLCPRLPKLNAHFFFDSALPIDDPLSPAPLPTTNFNTSSYPRPFSADDNAALEEAWLDIYGPDARLPLQPLGWYETRRMGEHGRERHIQRTLDRVNNTKSQVGLGPAAEPAELPESTLPTGMAVSGHQNSLKPEEHPIGVHGESSNSTSSQLQLAVSSLGNSSASVPEFGSGSTSSSDVVGTTAMPGKGSAAPATIGEITEALQTSGKPTHQSMFPFGQGHFGQMVRDGTLDKSDAPGRFPMQNNEQSTKSVERSPSRKPKQSGNEQSSKSEMGGQSPSRNDKQSSKNDERGRPPRRENRNSNNNDEGSQSPSRNTEQSSRIDERGRPPGRENRNSIYNDEYSRSSSRNNIQSSRDQRFQPPRKNWNSGRHDEHGRFRLMMSLARSRHPSPYSRPLVAQTTFNRALSRTTTPSSHNLQDDYAKQEALAVDVNAAGSPTSTASSDGVVEPAFGEYSARGTAQVPVGISRLHLVDLPAMEMKPIYWSPVHDVCTVVRGTWFYMRSMLPVEPNLANILETGYEYFKPWTDSYAEEVNSCLHHGSEAEAKLVYPLWSPPAFSYSSACTPKQSTAAETQHNIATKTASCSDVRAGGNLNFTDRNKKSNRHVWEGDSVIYKNGKEARILNPSQLPSKGTAFIGARKPLGHILRGGNMGEPVVRGFDYDLWEKLYPSKQSKQVVQAEEGAEQSKSGTTGTQKLHKACPPCYALKNRPKVTDLILVIHGIGQKLSERVESFNFTHSINSLRRQINVELGSDVIRSKLRDDLGGIMVLPVNWRSTISLDDEHEDEAMENAHKNEFLLKDITAPTIPAVRNLISDVLLDIPYYFSVDHKPKMIAAVVKEANRIYRRWCNNNPGFAASGRVHLIAHSLGSVMAVDILSKQPTRLPETILKSKHISTDMFEFDTKSLFFCGSPTGFFMLLNKASLVPRKGREKSDLDSSDALSAKYEGEAGTWGCLAVDNVYNIMHKNDPIAYRLNACVSVLYSESLLPANVPSSSGSWLKTLSSTVGLGATQKAALPATDLDAPPVRPTTLKLPSTIELETHNFSEEEIAEKKMYRLNDNGQIDYYLASGGGPLEIQYWNMLGAHSSYWVLRDFVRFVVAEVGRPLGRNGTFRRCRAVKKGWQGGRSL